MPIRIAAGASAPLPPTDVPSPVPPVIVLAPEPSHVDPELAYYTDYSENRDEFARALTALGRDGTWCPVAPEAVEPTLDAVLAEYSGRPLPTIINLCDGDGSNAVPGVEVIEALVARRFRFTGADAAFYRLTTSKRPMKRAFVAHGVPTPPFHVWVDGDDPDVVLARVGTPAIVKPAVSAGSMGMGVASVVETAEALTTQLARLVDGYRGWHVLGDGVLIERFVDGREFTALVVGNAAAGSAACLPPAERVFHTALPPTERWLTYDRLWEVYEEELPLPDGGYLWEYAPVDSAVAAAVERTSLAAYGAVGGVGYGRVDLRLDENTGTLHVLEVNAQCGLSESEDYTSVGAILRYAGWRFTDLVARMLADAEAT